MVWTLPIFYYNWIGNQNTMPIIFKRKGNVSERVKNCFYLETVCNQTFLANTLVPNGATSIEDFRRTVF